MVRSSVGKVAADPTARIAVLGRGPVPPGDPVLRGDDLGVLHGDGLFETMHLRDGRPWLRDEHLARLATAAAAVELSVPPASVLIDLLDQVRTGWPEAVEGALRLVCTRGPEAGGPPTIYATLAPVPAATRAARRDGITVATLPLGLPAAARSGLSWLPAGIKSTSYAVNSAARRWARRAGVDDVLWISSDGYALEGPTANVVWLTDGTLCTVPAASTGILAGTTAAWLLAHASELGLSAAERMVSTAELQAADGVWFTSSLRGAAKVHTLDGVRRAHCPRTPALQAVLGFPI
ncbi:aminotransferase class IV [Micromonospora sp. NBC_00821]|uniref:aminotransferase class IV n=1 Tax=Micromonospora sp. NBC_00821 TaxID=2975977 RepID=UPI002ED5591E|nr:aminotransferase class IV [Micromonospora sp. NBC_00821]